MSQGDHNPFLARYLTGGKIAPILNSYTPNIKNARQSILTLHFVGGLCWQTIHTVPAPQTSSA